MPALLFTADAPVAAADDGPAVSSGASLDPGASRFVPLDPRRLADTRTGAARPVEPGTALTLAVTAAGVPAGASAVVVNLTMTAPEGWGWALLYPAGTPPPTASSINVSGPGQTAAVAAVVRVGQAASIAITTSVRAHFVVDVAGYFERVASASGGRFVPVAPTRALDTRGTTPAAPGSALRLPLAGSYGLPAAGAAAVAISLTAVDASGAGWVQAIPTGGATLAGASSNLNVSYAGQTVANLAILPIGRDGSITLFTAARSHLLVDVVGWFTDTSAASSTEGLYVPADPKRLVDTRTGAAAVPGSSLFVPARPFVPSAERASALFVHVTAIDSRQRGFATVYPAPPVPQASNLNLDRLDQTIAVASVASLDKPGLGFRIYTSGQAHYAVDASGYFVREGTSATDGRCLMSFHAKGGGGQPPYTDDQGVRRLYPTGNAPGWGSGRHWSYFAEDTYRALVESLAGQVRDAECGRLILYGFSNGASLAAKLYCRGETFGGTLVGVVIDDPVVDQAVLGCRPAPGARAVLYWTGAIDQPDGWRCADGDWTCEGGTTIGIARYEAALGIARKPSIWSDHRQYDNPPELTSWW